VVQHHVSTNTTDANETRAHAHAHQHCLHLVVQVVCREHHAASSGCRPLTESGIAQSTRGGLDPSWCHCGCHCWDSNDRTGLLMVVGAAGRGSCCSHVVGGGGTACFFVSSFSGRVEKRCRPLQLHDSDRAHAWDEPRSPSDSLGLVARLLPQSVIHHYLCVCVCVCVCVCACVRVCVHVHAIEVMVNAKCETDDNAVIHGCPNASNACESRS
jgi:hypothetical protein